jgi:hypothetical protein
MRLVLVALQVSASGSVQRCVVRMGVVAGVFSGWRYDTLVVVHVKRKTACVFAFAIGQAYHAEAAGNTSREQGGHHGMWLLNSQNFPSCIIPSVHGLVQVDHCKASVGS